MSTDQNERNGLQEPQTVKGWGADAEQNCTHYLRHLSEYLDGALSEELCREIETHMAHCDNCRVVVNTLNKTVALYQRLPAPELPNAVREHLYRVLRLDDFYAPPRSDPS